MNQYKHLIAYDLTSYGAALSLVNQFVDGDTVTDFEVSPCGSQAHVILLSKDITALQIIKDSSLSFFKSQIFDVELIQDINEKLLPTYLSQNKTQLKKNLFILEGNSLAGAFVVMQDLLKQMAEPVDFRIVRTEPKSIILTATSDLQIDFKIADRFNYKKTIIENVRPSLKNFFEI